MRIGPICLSGIVLAIVPTAFAAEPDLKVELRKAEDKFVGNAEAKRTLYVITSPSGIGQVKVTRVSGIWPRNVALRFQYKPSHRFTNLEGFFLRTDRLEIRGFVRPRRDKASPKGLESQLHFWFLGPDNATRTQGTGDVPPAGTLDVVVREAEGALEFSLPANLLGDTRTMTLDWIDAYRN